jgi:alanine-glyoxylate transaminase/serine-glyoxylate transaminase/serine-pyruvate transaminase
MTRKPGRHFFANPGPTNIPDSVLHAVAHPSVDFNDPDFLEVYDAAVAGLRRILRTQQDVFLYTASGHGAWEATFANLFSPGDTILMLDSGYFSVTWGQMARDFGLEVRSVSADWRRGVDLAQVAAAVQEDTGRRIRAVCAVHNETSTGVTLPLQELRALLDDARHPAMFLTDTISSLGCLDFRMDDWGVDAVVGGSQKGLMLPTGFSFTAVSGKAMTAHKPARFPKYYFNWNNMLSRRQKSFVGTIPTGLFYGLSESLRLIEAEGLDAVIARHTRLAEGVRRCIAVWAQDGGPQLFCTDPARVSHSVSAVMMPPGHDAEAVRKIALDRFNVSLGFGLGDLGSGTSLFRIGHLGDLNEPMVLGTLGAVEMSLAIAGVPHGRGGVAAAMEFYAAA